MRIGEAVITAMRPIQAALQELSSRIAAVEHRADESYRLHVGHHSTDNRSQVLSRIPLAPLTKWIFS
jgi:hypothetical protein